MIEEEITFKTSRGLKLAGILLSPDEKLRDVVIFAHGTGSSKASPRNKMIAEHLLNRGIASFLFDFTGHGDSDGIPEQSTQDQQFDDLISALDFICSQTLFETRFLGVNGSSTGGTVAVRAAAEDPRIQVMVLRVPRSLGIMQYAPEVRAPTLIIQGSKDDVVLPEAKEIYEVLTCPKELQIIRGAGHLFDEKPSHMRRMTELTCAWFEQWFAKLAEAE